MSFSGRYQGNAALLIDNGNVTISSVTGKGKGTLVGASTITGKGSSSSSAQCDPFTGTGSITGAAAKLNLKVVESKSSGCSSGESGPVTVTFTGLAQVTGGTAKASGASGSLKFNGTLKLGRHKRFSKRLLHGRPHREIGPQGLTHEPGTEYSDATNEIIRTKRGDSSMNKLMTRIGVGTAALGLATMTIAFGGAGA